MYRARVLVVDDEPSICKAVEIALERAGFSPVVAQSGEAAVSLLHAQRFDALLVDLRIPDLRGDVLYELASALQPHLRGRTLFLTGDIGGRAQRLIDNCGCPVLSKPFDINDLIAAVRALTPRIRDASA